MHHRRKRLINWNVTRIKTFSLKDTVWEMKSQTEDGEMFTSRIAISNKKHFQNVMKVYISVIK